jgi:hypothetical protein
MAPREVCTGRPRSLIYCCSIHDREFIARFSDVWVSTHFPFPSSLKGYPCAESRLNTGPGEKTILMNLVDTQAAAVGYEIVRSFTIVHGLRAKERADGTQLQAFSYSCCKDKETRWNTRNCCIDACTDPVASPSGGASAGGWLPSPNIHFESIFGLDRHQQCVSKQS